MARAVARPPLDESAKTVFPRRPWIAHWLLAAALVLASVPPAHAAEPAVPKLSLEEVVARNLSARGGLEAWRAVHTMTWTGHIESARAPMPSLQFVMQQERPNKTHFEVNAMSERTLRVFDGAHGWKVRGSGSGGGGGTPQVRPYTIEELRYAQGAQGIDGPLIDYAAKGIQVALEGLDEFDGHTAYRLAVTLPSGEHDRLWLDSKTFLEIRYDRTPAGATGTSARVVSTFYRDYKTFDGLAMPTVIETGAAAGGTPDRMVIERVIVNPPLDKRAFSNPAARREHHALNYTPRPRPAPAVPLAPPAAPETPATPAPDSGPPPR